MLHSNFIDALVGLYLEEFSSRENANEPGSIPFDAYELREYFLWAQKNNLLFWEEKDNVIKAVSVTKPTDYEADWWDYDPYGSCLNIFLYISLTNDKMTKWRMLKEAFERFPYCTEVIWTHNKYNKTLKQFNVCQEPFMCSVETLKRQLKRYLKD